ncbi:MAG: hypothetical protein LLF96_02950 [Eubacteriales bacterium]|nr:hypothetical protein [Eubacteriales bacterium]
MRCGCPHCGAFMIQEEESRQACVCPACGYRCNACLGTGTAISREELSQLRGTEWFTPQFDGAAEEQSPLTPADPDDPAGS